MSERDAIPASRLWQAVSESGLRTLAVMGMAKNTGKTVTLNHLLSQAHAQGVKVGVTSIGRDGEERDQVFMIPKPPVLVWPGMVVATARLTLVRAKADWRFLGGTDVTSPMGEIVLVQVLSFGEMEIAGASLSREQHTIIAALQAQGCEVVVLDGALGRSHHASPAVADAVIMATGAAVGGGVPDVVRKTRDRLAILGIKAVEGAWRERVLPAFQCHGVGLWDAQGRTLLCETMASLNAATRVLAHLDDAPAVLAVSGAVGRLLWRAVVALNERHPGLKLVVADGTKLFVEHLDLQALRAQGGTVQALTAIRMLGITTNPFAPQGGSFDSATLLAAAQAALPRYTVVDVLLEEQQTFPEMNSLGVRHDAIAT